MKFTKKISVLLVAGLMFVAMFTVSASAKTLKQSFSSGTYVSYHHWNIFGNYYTKSCWAQTKGYKGNHYVRAMIGKGKNVWADTGRCYSKNNIKKICTTAPLRCCGYSWNFPTGYAYYGK